MSGPKPDILPGYPDPDRDAVRLFQRNNGLTADGLIGPKTRAVLWREQGEGHKYTHLASHPVRRGGAEVWAEEAQSYLRARGGLPLPADHTWTVLFLLSSEAKTGAGYMSSQDGLTWGFRRWAAGTLRHFIDDHADGFARYLGSYSLLELRTKLKDAPNNGWPSNDPAIRHGMLDAAQDGVLRNRQIEDGVRHVREICDARAWTHGRTLALACRAANSSPRFLTSLPRRDSDAYESLRERYSKRSKTYRRRIERIEALIPEGEIWR